MNCIPSASLTFNGIGAAKTGKLRVAFIDYEFFSGKKASPKMNKTFELNLLNPGEYGMTSASIQFSLSLNSIGFSFLFRFQFVGASWNFGKMEYDEKGQKHFYSKLKRNSEYANK